MTLLPLLATMTYRVEPRRATLRPSRRLTLDGLLAIAVPALVLGASGAAGRGPNHPRGVVVQQLSVDGRPHGVSIASNGTPNAC